MAANSVGIVALTRAAIAKTGVICEITERCCSDSQPLRRTNIAALLLLKECLVGILKILIVGLCTFVARLGRHGALLCLNTTFDCIASLHGILCEVLGVLGGLTLILLGKEELGAVLWVWFYHVLRQITLIPSPVLAQK